MVRTLLVRGMLVGMVAGLVAFGLARIWGEPQVDRAIAFEQALSPHEHAQHQHGAQAGDTMAEDTMAGGTMAHDMGSAAEPELVSRAVQSGIGLLTGVVVYGTAFGGLFALLFAFSYGRLGQLGPRPMALLLAAAGFLALVVVPGLKYPPSPPAVGNAETLGYRTALYLGMIAISIAAMGAAMAAARGLAQRYGSWTGAMAGGFCFVAMAALACLLMPELNEVPDAFPADVLWRFRLASIGVELVLWTVIGLLFGWAAERVIGRPVARASRA